MKSLAAAGALMIALAMPLAHAQDASQGTSEATSKDSSSTASPSQTDGTSPNNMGATGWTGPHRGPTSPGNPGVAAPSDSPDKQPAVATGSDLNGPPKEFPSNKAPE